MEKLRIYLTKKELNEYKSKHPNDLWDSINCALAKAKIDNAKEVTIIRHNPYWNPGFKNRKKLKPVYRGLYLTLDIDRS